MQTTPNLVIISGKGGYCAASFEENDELSGVSCGRSAGWVSAT